VSTGNTNPPRNKRNAATGTAPPVNGAVLHKRIFSFFSRMAQQVRQGTSGAHV
jgi:hypothetical protein